MGGESAQLHIKTWHLPRKSETTSWQVSRADSFLPNRLHFLEPAHGDARTRKIEPPPKVTWETDAEDVEDANFGIMNTDNRKDPGDVVVMTLVVAISLERMWPKMAAFSKTAAFKAAEQALGHMSPV
jgi:hypothetical protein